MYESVSMYTYELLCMSECMCVYLYLSVFVYVCNCNTDTFCII